MPIAYNTTAPGTHSAHSTAATEYYAKVGHPFTDDAPMSWFHTNTTYLFIGDVHILHMHTNEFVRP